MNPVRVFEHIKLTTKHYFDIDFISDESRFERTLTG